MPGGEETRRGTTKEKRAEKKSGQGLPVKKQPEPSMFSVKAPAAIAV